MYNELINYAVNEESAANSFIKLAYNLWSTVLEYCYKTLKINPTKWGGGNTSLLSQITSGKVESIITAVATGILILVFVVGVLREGGHIISEKGTPYGVISLMLRFFICAALIRGYTFITSNIFDVFTAAINGLRIGDKTSGFGLVDPEKASAILPKGSSGSIGQMILKMFSPSYTILDNTNQMLRLGLIEILGLIYLLIIVVCAFVVFFKVYGRYFKILICIILAPIGFSLYGSPMTEQQGKKFLFYLVKLGAEGLIMALILILYDKFVKTGKAIIPDFINALTGAAGKEDLLSTYVAFMISQIFFCILLVALISASEKIAEELL